MLNEDQRKHIANSIRIVAMAQFAVFGYPVVVELARTSDIPGRWGWVLASGAVYFIGEMIAVKVLGVSDG